MSIPYPSRPSAPLILTYQHPTTRGPGLWQVRHWDSTLLFETLDENEARLRLERLRELAIQRIEAGHEVTGRDVLTLWPQEAPSSLLSADGVETVAHRPAETPGPSVTRTLPPPARLSVALRDELVIERGDRHAVEAGLDPKTATAAQLSLHYERARRDLASL